MAAVIAEVMNSLCRETTAHVLFQIVLKICPLRGKERETVCLLEKALRPQKEHNAGCGVWARPHLRISVASSVIPHN